MLRLARERTTSRVEPMPPPRHGRAWPGRPGRAGPDGSRDALRSAEARSPDCPGGRRLARFRRTRRRPTASPRWTASQGCAPARLPPARVLRIFRALTVRLRRRPARPARAAPQELPLTRPPPPSPARIRPAGTVPALRRHAVAHALVVASEPAAGAALDGRAGPRLGALQQPHRPGAQPAGAARAGERASVACRRGHGRRCMLAARAEGVSWAPGAWRLRWQVLALDGHITRGDVPFTLRAR